MTCIIGIKEKGKVWMGSDKLCSNGHTKHIFQQPKINYIYWNNKPEFLVGVTSFNPHVMNLFFCNNYFTGEPLTNDPLKNIVNYLIPEIRKLLKDNDCYMKHEEGHQSIGSYFLISHKEKLFTMDPQFFVNESVENFVATGSGEEVAFGCLEILNELSYTPEQKIEKTMKIVSKHISSVSEEFDILSI